MYNLLVLILIVEGVSFPCSRLPAIISLKNFLRYFWIEYPSSMQVDYNKIVDRTDIRPITYQDNRIRHPFLNVCKKLTARVR